MKGRPRRAVVPGGPVRDTVDGHGHRLDDVTAAQIRQEIVATGLGLPLVLSAPAVDDVHAGDAQACRSAASLAIEIIYCCESR